MREVIDIRYTEFFEIGDKVNFSNKFGVVVKTYDLDENNRITGGDLIICWDTKVDCDFEVISKDKESFIFKIDPSYEFKYINDDGTIKFEK